ncbi:hypothetical protein [Rhodococcus sp. UFZ-B548]|uniref:hypothetical protein n=1 Tax=Rhodococcus sp. UFZ-B548 TaxID=2742212 RepID=UPI0015F4E21E|nr:hypothetical protein [Rhodococcus sp. UFZ-B548]
MPDKNARPIDDTDKIRALRLVLAAVRKDLHAAHVVFGELDTGDDALNLTMAVADIASVALEKGLGTENAETALLSDLDTLLS